jgi:hypothetical protein
MNANELANNQLTHVIGDTNAGEEVVITLRKPLYTESFVRQQQAEIEALREVNTKQVDYIAEQKLEYEKLWKEHMELFWAHEKDVEEEQEK